MKKIRNRLTYANVMSSLAVFLVLGGATAFAATKIGSNEIKANAILTGKIKKEAVTTSKIKNNAINTSKIANDAVTGDKVNESSLGQVPSAASAGIANAPTAWAHVNSTGNILASSGIGGATTTVSGDYTCFGGLPFTPLGGSVTTDYWNGTQTFATINQFGLASSGGLGGTGCPAGTQAFVFGRNANGSTETNLAFYIAFWR